MPGPIIAYGGIRPYPQRAQKTENELVGKSNMDQKVSTFSFAEVAKTIVLCSMRILSDIFHFVALILYFIVFSLHEILNLDHERKVFSIKLLIGIKALHLTKLMAMNEYLFSTEGLVEIWFSF